MSEAEVKMEDDRAADLVDDVDMDDDPNVKRRGRGFDPRDHGPASEGVKTGRFDTLDGTAESSDRAAKSVEGWVIVVTNIHEEATEEDVQDKFLDFGLVKRCDLNLDRRTGYVKGYALLEFAERAEAQEAIEACNDGLTLLDQELKADFAFVHPPAGAAAGRGTGSRRGNANRDRSRSPGR
ncbi:RNA recognition motif domain protein [Kalmanozyma brasiliensis GHG001]|uniref:RNA recognition motif domain protein n=1 Tax=Kalmanozyma brasiliensis (strain GHG001) TaxID=1365824 RepID=UPI002867FBF1|nr:RNA recognition motif domain protein [Kalmanozyma brasiliensis GHG001]KAF6766950.1 RNA recognition motif domain protein [Kalmanozyma brasiliensis GHG001]